MTEQEVEEKFKKIESLIEELEETNDTSVIFHAVTENGQNHTNIFGNPAMLIGSVVIMMAQVAPAAEIITKAAAFYQQNPETVKFFRSKDFNLRQETFDKE